MTNHGSSSSPAGISMLLGAALSSSIAFSSEISFLPLSLPMRLGIVPLGMVHELFHPLSYSMSNALIKAQQFEIVSLWYISGSSFVLLTPLVDI
jgi:hypothetical protein